MDVSSAAPLTFGAAQNGSEPFFGQFDEITFYDRALSQEELREILFAFGSGKCKDGDFVAPSVTITSPADGDALRGVVNFTSNVVDPDSDDLTVQFLVDGMQLGSDQTMGPGSFVEVLDTSTYPDGMHTLTVQATDAGMNSDSESIEVFFDNTPPVLSIFTPADMSAVSGLFWFRADAEDPASGLTSVTMSVDGAAPNDFDDSVVYGVPETAAVRRNSRVNTHEIMGASLLLEVTAVDDAGNCSTDQVMVTIDRSGGRARRGEGEPTDDVTVIFDDALLVVDPRGPVIGMLPVRDPGGRGKLVLRIGDEDVPVLARHALTGRRAMLLLAFDRDALLSAVHRSGERPPFRAELLAEGGGVGSFRMR